MPEFYIFFQISFSYSPGFRLSVIVDSSFPLIRQAEKLGHCNLRCVEMRASYTSRFYGHLSPAAYGKKASRRIWTFVLAGPSCCPQFSKQLDLNEHYYIRKSLKFWTKFYDQHKNKFFKDRHYLDKDWGKYFYDHVDNDTKSQAGKVVLEVGCGSGSSVFPLIDRYPELLVHACDFSPVAVNLVKSNLRFNNDRVNAFVADVTKDDLCTNIEPHSIDVATLIFVLSAVSPSKMPLVLQNLKRVLKPNGHVLLRDYAIGDFAQVKLEDQNQKISENFCFRQDGTCSFYFSEEFLSSLFVQSGFSVVDMNIYCRQIENRSKKISMSRRWIRASFSGCS